ncbi:hypothetical protein F0U59_47330 [Archangium gephyra]|nr:hypothetical protein F0U59_47330 [Archangium gephyra]
MLDQLAREGELARHPKLCFQFMAQCCTLIQEWIPPVAQQALEVAWRYWKQQASEENLTAARVRCWKYLDASKAGSDLDDRKTCAVRAVICCLYPLTVPEEIPEVLHTFMEFFDTVEHHPSEQTRILKELFAAQLAEHEH